MAEDEAKPATPKKTKKALPEAPPEEPALKVPSAAEIRAAKKAELVAWCEAFDLGTEGKVDELRKRVADYAVSQQRAAQAKAAEEKPAAAEKPAEAKAPKKATRAPAKKPAGKPAEEPEKEEAEEEKEEEEGEEEYEPNLKPKLDPAFKRLLAVRAAKSAARPAFHRQEWFRYKRFGDEWRKPQGGQSKLRRHFGYRWNLPSVGYRGPREVRGLHPSGFQEVLVHNERQLEGLDPAKQAVRVAHGVGTRKREIIEKACDDKGLRVLNRMVTE